MDRALLERMVGAAVLVLIFVVVAPMLLDGRDEDDPGAAGKGSSSAGSRRTEVIVLNSPSQSKPEPAPEVKQSGSKSAVSAAPRTNKPGKSETSNPATPPKNKLPKTAVSKPAVSKPAASSLAAAKPAVNQKESQAPREGFAIQVGSFSSRDNAVGFAGSVRDGGYPVFVVKGAAGSGAVWRVYVGPKDSRKDAEGLAARLAADGTSVLVVDLAGGAGG